MWTFSSESKYDLVFPLENDWRQLIFCSYTATSKERKVSGESHLPILQITDVKLIYQSALTLEKQSQKLDKLTKAVHACLSLCMPAWVSIFLLVDQASTLKCRLKNLQHNIYISSALQRGIIIDDLSPFNTSSQICHILEFSHQLESNYSSFS